MSRLENELRKQKRLGPAPIASFEKSFEDSSTPMPGPAVSTPVVPVTIVTASSVERPEMDSGGPGTETNVFPVKVKPQIEAHIIRTESPAIVGDNGGPLAKTTTNTVKTISSARKLHDIGKRPPPLQQAGGSPVTTASTGGTSTISTIATLGVHTPSTPRIDISRASSSSHHEDSRDSSPENVFEQVGTGTLQETIGLGFREEGALELRSSTEELYFMDPEQKREEQEKLQQARKSPVIFKFDEHQTYLQQHQRKDSASSEVAALLCISGRTSRISSVGSQGSAVSRLSAISGVSRSPSPHRMLLETSFCGPKPLENVVDGSIVSSVEPPTAEVLEQVLLARKHDPTQAVLAEGIKIEESPKKKLTNGDTKRKVSLERPPEVRVSKTKSTVSAPTGATAPNTVLAKAPTRKPLTPITKKDTGKPIVGVTPSGTEYIRIKLKPDYLYDDKGLAPNERVIEAAAAAAAAAATTTTTTTTAAPVPGEHHHKKPVSLSLGREISAVEQRLTPSSSPKPARHAILSREVCGSRSPSPATVAVSRKSSFCSLFKPKDSPDSPRDRSRSRSKSRDRSTPQSQSGTPSKQKSVLAIFKPKRSGSKSKCSSPVDQDTMSQLDGISQVEFKFKSDHTESKSRPSSRLRYYDTPLDGKSIHIPLHTPPEEKEDRRFAPGREMKEPEPPPEGKAQPLYPLPSSQTEEIIKQASAITQQLQQLPGSTTPSAVTASAPPTDESSPRPGTDRTVPPALPQKATKQAQIEKQIENLDAIHTLPQDVNERERTWSLEVQRHSSQESQETVSWDNSNTLNSRRISKPNLTDVIESPLLENGVPPAIVQNFVVQESQQQRIQTAQQQPLVQTQTQSQTTHPPTSGALPTSREKKRLLFATRIGSGSEEQIFSTQFSLSKTESLSSQLSEQTSIPDSPAMEGRGDTLHRTDTVIRRPDDANTLTNTAQRRKHVDSTVDDGKQSATVVSKKSNSINSGGSSSDDVKRKSKSASEDEEKRPIVVMMRKKDLADECRRKSKSASEEDDPTTRHSRYIENFDHKKKYHETKRQQSSHNSSDSSIKERDSHTSSREEPDVIVMPTAHLVKSSTVVTSTPTPTSTSQTMPVVGAVTSTSKSQRDSQIVQTERQSVISTDDLIESSESERDSEMDPNRIKRHLPRHIGAVEDHESTGLVSQDSFEDELPYVPTTLPEERAHGVSLIPMKERINMEVKTCSVDRPRSTTPMNPACLEEYCGIVTPDDNDNVPVRGEKLRISLPRKDSTKDRTQKTKSPRRISNASGKSWFEFAEQGIRGSSSQTTPTQPCATELRRGSSQDDEPPPPLPPRKPATGSSSQGGRSITGHWIDFESIPEKRKAPKRITALPKDSPQETKPPTSIPSAHQHHQQQQQQQQQQQVQYNYVKPEECQCECHEVERETAAHKSIANVDLLQQGEDMQPLLEPESQEGIDPSDSSIDYSYGADMPSTVEQKPFEMDLSLGQAGSNRSSIHSQDPESPDQLPLIHDSNTIPTSYVEGRQRKAPGDYRNP